MKLIIVYLQPGVNRFPLVHHTIKRVECTPSTTLRINKYGWGSAEWNTAEEFKHGIHLTQMRDGLMRCDVISPINATLEIFIDTSPAYYQRNSISKIKRNFHERVKEKYYQKYKDNPSLLQEFVPHGDDKDSFDLLNRFHQHTTIEYRKGGGSINIPQFYDIVTGIEIIEGDARYYTLFDWKETSSQRCSIDDPIGLYMFKSFFGLPRISFDCDVKFKCRGFLLPKTIRDHFSRASLKIKQHNKIHDYTDVMFCMYDV